MKIKIALFFFIFFGCILTAPTVLSLLNEDQDISIFLSLNEEEEENLEIKTCGKITIATNTYTHVFFKKIQKIKNIRFTSKKYTVFFPKTVTPPPEFLS